MRRSTLLFYIINITVFYIVSGFCPHISQADQLPVFVSILPQKYFVQQIGKDKVDIRVMVAPGASPATYEPKPSQMAALATTRIYFSIGVPFEAVWLKKIAATNPMMAIVPTDHGIAKLDMARHNHNSSKESSGVATSHRHGVKDPHIWTSPPLVMLQARAIVTALQAVDPVNTGYYETNYKAFIDALVGLDFKIRELLADKKGASFLVFHPSWGYFAHTYGLNQVAIEIEGKEPKAASLESLIDDARQENIKAVFVQPQFSSKAAELIARAIGGKVIPADPLAGDWASNLLEQARRFKAASR